MLTNDEITDIVIDITKINPELAARVLRVFLLMKDEEKLKIIPQPYPIPYVYPPSMPYWCPTTHIPAVDIIVSNGVTHEAIKSK